MSSTSAGNGTTGPSVTTTATAVATNNKTAPSSSSLRQQHQQSKRNGASKSTKTGDNPAKMTGTFDSPTLIGISLAMMISGLTIGWRKAGEEGFGYVMMLLTGTTLAYFSLTACLAEMNSMFPFSGGVFGYVRCSLGPYMGFMGGAVELMQSLLFLAAMVNGISDAIIDTAIGDDRKQLRQLEPLVWFGALVVPSAIQCYGGKGFWRYTMGVSALALLLAVIYIIGSVPAADYGAYAHNGDLGSSQVAHGTKRETTLLFRHIHEMMWIYKGAEMPPLLCDEAKNVKNVPKAMFTAVVIMALLAFPVVFLSLSQSPGLYSVSQIEFPLGPGFEKIFDLTRNGHIFSIPFLLASSQAFLYAFSKQVHAMSLSGLLPKVFSRLDGPNETPVISILIGSTTVFVLLVTTHLKSSTENVLEDLYTASFILLSVMYIQLFYAYYTFVTRFSNVERSFRIPPAVAIAGCVWGLITFGMALVGLAVFDFGSGLVLEVICGFIVLSSLYYKFVVETRQFFSPEEQKIFLKAYIVNSHVYKKNANHMLKLAKKILFCVKWEEQAKKKKVRARGAAEKEKRKQEKVDKMMSPTIARLVAHDQTAAREAIADMSLSHASDSESSQSSSSHHSALVDGVSAGIFESESDSYSEHSNNSSSSCSLELVSSSLPRNEDNYESFVREVEENSMSMPHSEESTLPLRIGIDEDVSYGSTPRSLSSISPRFRKGTVAPVMSEGEWADREHGVTLNSSMKIPADTAAAAENGSCTAAAAATATTSDSAKPNPDTGKSAVPTIATDPADSGAGSGAGIQTTVLSADLYDEVEASLRYGGTQQQQQEQEQQQSTTVTEPGTATTAASASNSAFAKKQKKQKLKITWSGKVVSDSEKSKKLFEMMSGSSGRNHHHHSSSNNNKNNANNKNDSSSSRSVQKAMIQQFPELFALVDGDGGDRDRLHHNNDEDEDEDEDDLHEQAHSNRGAENV